MNMRADPVLLFATLLLHYLDGQYSQRDQCPSKQWIKQQERERLSLHIESFRADNSNSYRQGVIRPLLWMKSELAESGKTKCYSLVGLA